MNHSGSPPSTDADADLNTDRVPVERLAEDFLDRLRRGEKPSIDEYVRGNPELAVEIRKLFPTLALLEDCAPAAAPAAAPPFSSAGVQVPERLGEYRILGEIGRGGMGVVYEAEHETLRRRVALKLLPTQLTDSPAALQRFLREARAAGRLHHTNIVPVFEVGVHDDIHFYAMQYIHGQNLDVVIDELRRLKSGTGNNDNESRTVQSNLAAHQNLSRTVAHELLSGEPAGPLQYPLEPKDVPRSPELLGGVTPPPKPALGETADSGSLSQVGHSHEGYFQRVARVGLQVADALQFAHRQGILHRDIKPSNLILDTTGTIWITDFGLAKHEGDDFTHTGDIVGTLRYMAPERLHGHADERSDVYSLGLTLYELTTLQSALQGEDRVSLIGQIEKTEPPRPRQLVPQIPRDLETIILKSIEKSPAHRYQSAEKLSADLQLFLADRPILARRSTWIERGWRWCRRNPVPATLTICITALVLLLFVGTLAFALFSTWQANLLAHRTRVANQAQRTAELSREEAVRRLYDSYLGQARAGRWSARAGQHFETLNSLRQAAELLPSLKLGPREERRRRLILRNEAIAAMPLVDLREVQRWNAETDDTAVFALPPDYSVCAISDREGNIVVRRLADGAEVMRLAGPGHRAWLLTFSPDGRYLAGKFHRGVPSPTPPMVRVWDLSTQKVVIDEKQNLSLARMAFRNDCREYALGFDSHEVRIYRLPEGEMTTRHKCPNDPLDLCYDPTGESMAITYPGVGPVEIWDRKSDGRKQIQVAPDVNSLAWSPNGAMLAMGTYTGEIYLQDIHNTNRRPLELKGHLNRVVRLAYSHHGDLLMSRAWDSSMRIWTVASGEEACRHEVMPLSGTGFRRDDSLLAFRSGDGDASFGVWEVARGRMLQILTSDSDVRARSSVAFHPSHPRLLASATEKGVEIWDVGDGTRVTTLPVRAAKSARFSPDGMGLYTSGPPGVQYWAMEESSLPMAELQFGKPTTILKQDSNRVDLATGRPLLASDHEFVSASVINLDETNSPRRTFRHPNVDYAVISADGRWVVTTTWHGSGVRVWDLEDDGNRTRFLDLAPRVLSATPAFSPDGRYLAVSDGYAYYVWEVGSWRRLYRIKRQHPDGWPGPVAFSPDGRLLAVAHTRYVAQLIDPGTGRTLGVLEAPASASLKGYSFSADGRYLAVADTKTIQLWDLTELRARLAEMQLDWTLTGE